MGAAGSPAAVWFRGSLGGVLFKVITTCQSDA